MQYAGLAWFTGFLALLVSIFALRVLFDLGWLLGWLRGTLGLLCLALAGILGLSAYDLSLYKPLPEHKPLVTLSFQASGQQRYQVTVLEGAKERRVSLDGDLWQLDVRLLGWKGLAGLIGLAPGYRLEQLTGRFLAIEQQSGTERPKVVLSQSPYQVDVWQGLKQSGHDLYSFKLDAARVSYLPMADQAVYSISLTPAGLLATPVNSQAQEALRNWQ